MGLKRHIGRTAAAAVAEDVIAGALAARRWPIQGQTPGPGERGTGGGNRDDFGSRCAPQPAHPYSGVLDRNAHHPCPERAPTGRRIINSQDDPTRWPSPPATARSTNRSPTLTRQDPQASPVIKCSHPGILPPCLRASGVVGDGSGQMRSKPSRRAAANLPRAHGSGGRQADSHGRPGCEVMPCSSRARAAGPPGACNGWPSRLLCARCRCAAAGGDGRLVGRSLLNANHAISSLRSR
jgi:hypothetical protein